MAPCRTCYYRGHDGLCDFYLMTGIRRGCPPAHCTRWEPRDALQKQHAVTDRNKQYDPKTAGVRDRMLQLYKEGATDAQIAEATGKSVRTVEHWRHGLGFHANRTRRADDHAEQLQALYDAGAKDPELAAATGLSVDSVKNWRRDKGLPAQCRRNTDQTAPKAESVQEKMRRLYEEGATDAWIAESTGRTISGVRSWRSRNCLYANRSQTRTQNAIATHAERMMEMYQAGAKDPEIAAATGLSVCSVERWRWGLGLPAQCRRGKTEGELNHGNT